MRASSIIRLALLVAVSLAAALPACGGEFFFRRSGTGSGAGFGSGSGSWNNSYYDPAWGMPLAVVVPPNARFQTDYSWGAGGTRISRIGARYQPEYPGPESSYRQSDYMPAPPQPSDTRQFGDNYVRAPRR